MKFFSETKPKKLIEGFYLSRLRGGLIIILILLSCAVFAKPPATQAGPVNISLTNIDLNKVLQKISKQTGARFLYHNELLQREGKVSINANNISVEEALGRLLHGRGLTYTVVDSVYILTPVEDTMDKVPQHLDARIINDAENEDQQGIDVSGIVTDVNNIPLPGATVIEKGTQNGVATGDDGKFNITVEDHTSVLQVSFLGYQTVEVEVGAKNYFTIQLKENVSQLDEVVVTGYNTIEKRKLTSAVTLLSKEEIVSEGEQSIDKLLQGKVAGMTIVNSSGEVGSVPVVKIRGTSTLTGNASPLWVVDGVVLEDPVPLTPAELNTPDVVNRIGNALVGINPEDIESINVLKDASATAIYGVSAAGGVVVLTTKKGHKGTPVINFNTNTTVSLPPSYSQFNLMNSKERVEIEEYYMDQGYQYYNADGNIYSVGLTGAYARYKNRDLPTWADFENEVRNAQTYNTDWFDVLFRNGVSSNTNMNVSGGSEKTTYYASLSYLDQTGTDILTDNNRYNGSIKLNFDLAESVNLEFYLSGYSNIRSSYPYSMVPSGISNFTRPTPRPFDYAINTSRTFPVENPDGSYYFYRGHSDFYLFNIMNEYENSNQITKANGVTSRASLDLDLADNLKVFGVFNYTSSSTQNETYYKENTNQVAGIRQSEFGDPPPDYSNLPNGGVIFSNNNFQDYYMLRLATEYKPISTDVHQLQIYAGGEYRANNYRGDNTIGWGYLHDRGRTIVTSPNIGEELSGAPYLTISDYARKYASYYGVSSYTYKNKYTLNGNIRFDGSNLFGSNPKYRWKPAWSVSGRWNVMEEAFMENASFVSNLAFRASYGVQGSTNEQNTPQIVASFMNPAYWSGLNLLTIQQPANPNLRWEKTYNTNIGFDLALFNNRISAAVDLYNRKGTDLITNTRISEINGFSYLPINFADVTNRGIELGLTTMNVSKGKFSWSTTINFAYNHNEVTKVNLEPNVSRMLSSFPYKPDAAIEGRPLNALYSVDFVELGENGVARFLTSEGDTTTATRDLVFGVDDLVYNGPIEAPYTGGINNLLTYGNFRLTLFFTYGLGNYMRMPEIMQSWMYAPDQNLSRELNDAWKEDGDEEQTSIPNIKNETGSNNHKYYWNKSDIRVVKGDYLRLKNITLQYYLPNNLLNRLNIEKAFVQVETNNIWLLADKRLNGYDPETFIYQSLPNPKSFLLGLNVTF
jgi:TonB-linked SusC/RagA family outer membrane protein